MKFLSTFFTELIGLFIDDWAFAVLLLVWIGLYAELQRYLPVSVAAPLLVAGLIVLTLVFVVRHAYLRSRPK